MNADQVHQLANDYTKLQQVPAGSRYLARADYAAGFMAAIELVNKLNDGNKMTIYAWDTADYSSQRKVKDILKELQQ